MFAGPFTPEFWFKPSATHDYSTPRLPGFFSKGSDDSVGLANADNLPGGNDGTLEVRGPVPRPFTTTDRWLAGKWYHAAVAFDGAGYKVYVNGVQEAGVASAHSILSNPNDILLGTVPGFAPSGATFAGLVDEMALYKRALTPAEVLAIYDARSVGKCQPTNRAPVADAGPDQTFAVAGPASLASLDGSGSSDPDGDTLAYEWRDAGGNVVGNTAAVSAPVNLGANVFTLTVTDPPGASASDTVAVIANDEAAPVTVATLSTAANNAGWNNSDVTVSLHASDNAGGSGVKRITYSATGAHVVPQTVAGGDTASVHVAAEGVTTVTFFAEDNAGNVDFRSSRTRPGPAAVRFFGARSRRATGCRKRGKARRRTAHAGGR